MRCDWCERYKPSVFHVPSVLAPEFDSYLCPSCAIVVTQVARRGTAEGFR